MSSEIDKLRAEIERWKQNESLQMQRAIASEQLTEELSGLLRDVLDSDAHDDLGGTLRRRIDVALLARNGQAGREVAE